jgi:homocysteine S-methyltransferase
MSKYRQALPQLQEELFLTDGGIETTLIFHEGATLPYFASFVLLKDESGTALLRRYFERYAELARVEGLGLVLETPTWRANPDWAAKLGYDAPALAEANRRSVDLLLGIRRSFEAGSTRIVISGNLGPRGDGYDPGGQMSASKAQAYHASQIETLAATDADMIAAFTMNYVEEAVGYSVYYMINCAHPTHLETALSRPGEWRDRICGLRANASRRSHKELDESPDLDAGNPEELGREYRALRSALRNLSVVGGCCGTDHRHVAAIARALQPARALA